MKWKVLGAALAAFVGHPASAAETSFYNLEAKTIEGKQTSLSQYKGQVALVVNTASRCGYTSQYKDLEATYEQLKAKGFVVLGFPSNDFGGQEPGSDAEIKKFCEVSFRVGFPLFSKAPVSGEKKQPIYKYLVDHAPKTMPGEVQWNFEKFLIDREGKVVGRFPSAVKPSDPKIRNEIEKLLSVSKKS